MYHGETLEMRWHRAQQAVEAAIRRGQARQARAQTERERQLRREDIGSPG